MTCTGYLFWIIILLSSRALSAETCKSQHGMVEITITCSSGRSCCEDNTNCCSDSKLSTTVIIAFAVGGTIVLATIVIVIILAIVKYKKSNVTPVTQNQPVNATQLTDLLPYTPRVLTNHPPPAPPPRYEDVASGSFPSTGNATTQSERKVPL